jgi:hypothetical protein
MSIYKIRATGEVLDTTTATRRTKVHGQVLTFGREPVYVEADELPRELAADLYLKIDTVESAPAGAEVIDLKSERVQEESAADPGESTDLKSERVQEESAAAPGDDIAELKSERVQEPARKRR